MLTLTSAVRRRISLHRHRLFSSPSAASDAGAAAGSDASTSFSSPSDLSAAINSLFRSESDPARSVSILFRFPTWHYDRFAGDTALRRLSGAGSISALLLNKFLPLARSEKHFAALLLSYGAAELPACAIRAFNDRIYSSLPVSVLSFNALLSAFIKSDHHREVHNIFRRMTVKHEQIRPDLVSYGLLVQALFRSKKSELAFEVLRRAREERGIVLTPQIYNLLFVSIKKLNNPDLAEQFWNEMIENGVKPDFAAFKIKVWCHAVRLDSDKVIEAMRNLELNGFKPDVFMYNSLLVCFCKNGRMDRAVELYKAMKQEKDLSLNFDTFNTLMNGLNRIEDFETGMEVFRDSVRIDRIANVSILRDFVGLLVKKGKVEMGKEVLRDAKNKSSGKLTSQWKEIEDLLGQE